MLLFTPKNESLSERLKALQSILKANRDIELSIERAKNKEWANKLGSPEELKQAQEITQKSMDMAIKSIRSKDLKEAREQGLLSPSEASEIKVLIAQNELANKSTKKHSKSHSKK